MSSDAEPSSLGRLSDSISVLGFSRVGQPAALLARSAGLSLVVQADFTFLWTFHGFALLASEAIARETSSEQLTDRAIVRYRPPGSVFPGRFALPPPGRQR